MRHLAACQDEAATNCRTSKMSAILLDNYPAGLPYICES
jgi:hypothetical protein